jgi:hypothetical protein
LEGIVFDKRSLKRVQVLIIGESLDRYDLGTLMRDGESEATVHPPAIKQNGTGAALPVVTTFLGTGEYETLAQRVQERRPGIDEKLARCPVNLENDLHVHSLFASFSTHLYLLPCFWIEGTYSRFALPKSVGGMRCSILLRFVLFQTSNLLLQSGHVLLQFLYMLLQRVLMLFKHETSLGERSGTLAAQFCKAHHLCERHACIP